MKTSPQNLNRKSDIHRVSKRLADGTVKIYEYSKKERERREERRADLQRTSLSIELIPIYRKRANSKKIEFTIDHEWLDTSLKAQGDKCAVSGLPFDYLPQKKKGRKHFKNPMRPSLDRINNSRGYEPDNIRIVLHCVNIAINEWGLELYQQVCKAVANEADK